MSLFKEESFLKVHKHTLFSATYSIFHLCFPINSSLRCRNGIFMFLVNGFQEIKVDGSLSKVKEILLSGPLMTDCGKKLNPTPE